MRCLIALLAVLTAVLAWTLSPVLGYPITTTVSASVSDANPAPGEGVTVTCTVLGTEGDPVAGQPCAFSVVSGPEGTSFGGAASTIAYSDSNGLARAVLSTGASPGVIIVRVESGGIASQTTISTGPPQELPATGGPAREARNPLLPATGAALAAAGAALVIALLRRRA